jgi:hypothetical protein
MALHQLRLAPLALLRVAGLPPLASSRFAARHHQQLLLYAPPARPWRLLAPAARPRSLATAAAEADDTGASSGDGFFAEESTSWGSLGISDRLASALRGAGLARPSLVQVMLSELHCCWQLQHTPRARRNVGARTIISCLFNI